MHSANRLPRLVIAIPVMCFTICFLPASADAQFGGLVKRAIGQKVIEKVTEKVTKPEGQKADSAAGTVVPGGRRGRMASDAPMTSVQLTADTLDMAVRGLDVLARAFARRDSLGVRGDAVGKRLGELSSANVDLSRVYSEKAGVIHSCLEDAYFAAAQQRGKELQARAAADPGLQRRYAQAWPKYSAAAQEAAARADTVTMRRVMTEYYREVFGASFSSRQDTVTAHRKCGIEPPRPAPLALEDSLRRESQRLADARRELEIAARTDAIAQSGLPADKFDAAREKIELWYRARKSGHVSAFTAREEDALAAQLPRIERIMRALGVAG